MFIWERGELIERMNIVLENNRQTLGSFELINNLRLKYVTITKHRFGFLFCFAAIFRNILVSSCFFIFVDYHRLVSSTRLFLPHSIKWIFFETDEFISMPFFVVFCSMCLFDRRYGCRDCVILKQIIHVYNIN